MEDFELFSLVFNGVEETFGDVFLLNSKKFHLLFPDFMGLSSSQKGSPIFLNNNDSLLLLIFDLSGSVFLEFVAQFGVLMSSDNALSSSLKFLDDSDGSFHVGIESDFVMGGFNLFADSKLPDDFFDGEISGIFGVVDEAGKGDFEGFGGEFHVHEDLIDVDKIRLDDVGMGGVADDILFDLAHPDHGIVEHLFHEYSFLWVYHLIVGLFKFAIGF